MARKSSPPDRLILTMGFPLGPPVASKAGAELFAVFVACLPFPLLSFHSVTGAVPVTASLTSRDCGRVPPPTLSVACAGGLRACDGRKVPRNDGPHYLCKTTREGGVDAFLHAAFVLPNFDIKRFSKGGAGSLSHPLPVCGISNTM